MKKEGPHLTEREQQILDLLGRAWDNARIANELNLAEQTVRNLTSQLYAKVGIKSRTEAVLWAKKHEWE